MKRISAIALTLIMATILFATSALAWRSVRTGQKNFERAWSSMLFLRADQAGQYFAQAAEAFGLALAEQPPSRTTMFASNLTMAGISFYYAGRYQECVDAMDKAIRKDDRIWEGYLYKGLSLAAMDDKGDAVKMLRAYIDASPSQPILSSEVSRQITDLETNSGTLEAARTAIEKAALEQFVNNYTLQAPSNMTDMCEGRYWWRNNKAPCSEKMPYRN